MLAAYHCCFRAEWLDTHDYSRKEKYILLRRNFTTCVFTITPFVSQYAIMHPKGRHEGSQICDFECFTQNAFKCSYSNGCHITLNWTRHWKRIDQTKNAYTLFTPVIENIESKTWIWLGTQRILCLNQHTIINNKEAQNSI